MSIFLSILQKIINSKLSYIIFLLLLECYAISELYSLFVASQVRSNPMYGLLAGMVAIGVVIVAKKAKKPLLVSPAAFWSVLLMAVVLNVSMNYEAHTTLHQLPNALMVTSGLLMLTYALFRRYFVLAWMPLLVILAFVNIAYHEYDIVIDSVVLAQIQNATAGEVLTYVTFRNVSFLLLFLLAIVGVFWLLHRAIRKESRITLVCSGLLIVMFCFTARLYLQPLMSNVACGLWPVKSLSNFAKTAYAGRMTQDKFIAKLQSLKSPADDASHSTVLKGNEGVVIIFHIGESVRADHLSVNGYYRDTTPHLKALSNMVSFKDCSAAAGLTSYAWPTIMTNARRGYNINPKSEFEATRGSFIDLLDKHGFDCYAAIPKDFVGADSVARIVHKLLYRCKEVYVHGDGHEELLGLVNKMTKREGNQNKFIVLNDIGSHFPFWHYDDARAPFQPSSRSAFGNAPGKNPDEAEKALNAYDNTIHQLDCFIHESIQALQGLPYIYIYVSDHGEALGEQGEWSRTFSYQESSFHAMHASQVPLLMIYSDELLRIPHFRQAIETLRAHKDMRTAHEHIYHTILGLVGIQAESYDAALDLTSPHVKPYSGPHPDDAAHSRPRQASAP